MHNDTNTRLAISIELSNQHGTPFFRFVVDDLAGAAALPYSKLNENILPLSAQICSKISLLRNGIPNQVGSDVSLLLASR